MQIIIGADGCKSGWVFIRLVDGMFSSAKVYRQFADGVNASPDAAVIGVDIPIGYPRLPAKQRKADDDARAVVGPRHASVFPALHPDALVEPDLKKAKEISLERTGRSLTNQSFGLRKKILEVDPVVCEGRAGARSSSRGFVSGTRGSVP